VCYESAGGESTSGTLITSRLRAARVDLAGSPRYPRFQTAIVMMVWSAVGPKTTALNPTQKE
jgi:hypothetical protein